MSKWLALARSLPPVPLVPLVPLALPPSEAIGTNGAIGTAAGETIWPAEDPIGTNGAIGTHPAIQTNVNACWVCSGRETVGRMFLAVCSDIPGRHHWMHSACWPEHVRRCTAQREGSPS